MNMVCKFESYSWPLVRSGLQRDIVAKIYRDGEIKTLLYHARIRAHAHAWRSKISTTRPHFYHNVRKFKTLEVWSKFKYGEYRPPVLCRYHQRNSPARIATIHNLHVVTPDNTLLNTEQHDCIIFDTILFQYLKKLVHDVENTFIQRWKHYYQTLENTLIKRWITLLSNVG